MRKQREEEKLMTVPVPKDFEECAKQERRSVSNLARIAFDEYVSRKQISEKKKTKNDNLR